MTLNIQKLQQIAKTLNHPVNDFFQNIPDLKTCWPFDDIDSIITSVMADIGETYMSFVEMGLL